jgi:hypothetical protein
MRLDKKFLARLLDISEETIANIKGMTFELTTAPGDAPETFEGWLDKRFKKKLDALTMVLVRQDELGTIVRALIHIEHELDDFIYFAAPSPAHLKRMDLDFFKKVQLALPMVARAKRLVAPSPVLLLGPSHRIDGIGGFLRMVTHALLRRSPSIASNSARPVETVRPSHNATAPPAPSTAATRSRSAIR